MKIMSRMKPLVLVAIVLLHVGYSLSQCPSTVPACTCEDVTDQSRRNIRCVGLSQIPAFTSSPEIFQKLDMDNPNNNIQVIQANAFSGIKVEEIDMSGQNIRLQSIHPMAFSGFEQHLTIVKLQGDTVLAPPFEQLRNITNLQVLELQFFNMPTIEESTEFNYFPYLTTLRLRNMNTHFVSSESFKNQLQELTVLEFANNQVPTFPKPAINRLRKLQHLSWVHNGMTTISYSSFDSLSSLTELDLRGNDIGEMFNGSFIGITDKLQFLSLQLNRLTKESIVPLGQHIWLQLEQLNLGFMITDFTGIPDGLFRNMPKLAYLLMPGNKLRVIKSNDFQGLSNMHVLDLSENWVNTIQMGALSPMTRLDTLDLRSQYDLSVNSPMNFSLDALKGVELALKTLYLDNNHLIDQFAWEAIGAMKNLVSLHISGTGLSDIPSLLFYSHNKLKSLTMRNNNMAVLREESLYGLKYSLEVIDISDNQLYTIEECVFKDFNKLIYFLASQNSFVCDCNLYGLYEILKEITFAFLACKNPANLAGTPLLTLKSGQLCSNPPISSTCLFFTTTKTSTSTTETTSGLTTTTISNSTDETTRDQITTAISNWTFEINPDFTKPTISNSATETTPDFTTTAISNSTIETTPDLTTTTITNLTTETTQDDTTTTISNPIIGTTPVLTTTITLNSTIGTTPDLTTTTKLNSTIETPPDLTTITITNSATETTQDNTTTTISTSTFEKSPDFTKSTISNSTAETTLDFTTTAISNSTVETTPDFTAPKISNSTIGTPPAFKTTTTPNSTTVTTPDFTKSTKFNLTTETTQDDTTTTISNQTIGTTPDLTTTTTINSAIETTSDLKTIKITNSATATTQDDTTTTISNPTIGTKPYLTTTTTLNSTIETYPDLTTIKITNSATEITQDNTTTTISNSTTETTNDLLTPTISNSTFVTILDSTTTAIFNPTIGTTPILTTTSTSYQTTETTSVFTTTTISNSTIALTPILTTIATSNLTIRTTPVFTTTSTSTNDTILGFTPTPTFNPTTETTSFFITTTTSHSTFGITPVLTPTPTSTQIIRTTAVFTTTTITTSTVGTTSVVPLPDILFGISNETTNTIVISWTVSGDVVYLKNFLVQYKQLEINNPQKKSFRLDKTKRDHPITGLNPVSRYEICFLVELTESSKQIPVSCLTGTTKSSATEVTTATAISGSDKTVGMAGGVLGVVMSVWCHLMIVS